MPLTLGLYFDPAQTIRGHWAEEEPKIKIAVERCGCNDASHHHVQKGQWLLVVWISSLVFQSC